MPTDHNVEIRHFHLFCGSGGGAYGFNQGEARVGNVHAKFRCIGGIDSDAGACRDFTRLVGTPATCMDLFDAEQYRDFHGHYPPLSWAEAGPDHIRRAAGGERPHIVFLSPPCKGLSSLLSGAKSASPRYQALNRLVVRGIFLMLQAWGDDPSDLIILENVPRILQRGRKLLDQVVAMLRSHGYATAETVHDCGEVGGLAQHRKRMLLVARRLETVPSFLYTPPKRRVRAIGEVLSELPMPDDPVAGPMHRLPALDMKTWLRLALIPAGKDWRALRGMNCDALRLVSLGEHAKMRVEDWRAPSHTVTGSDRVGSGALSVADPRFHPDALPVGAALPDDPNWRDNQQYGVRPWSEPSGTVTGQSAPGGGMFSVADPRHEAAVQTQIAEAAFAEAAFADGEPAWRGDVLGVHPWTDPSSTVTGRANPTTGVFSVADPRAMEGRFNNIYRVVRWDEPCVVVTAGAGPASGGLSVADPRGADKEAWATAGHYGVLPWESASGAVTGSAGPDNGRNNVADPRPVPAPTLGSPYIISLDGTRHRPLTTLDLAALQGFPTKGLILDGKSTARWREHIGNAVPPPAAKGIADVMGQVLLLAFIGTTQAIADTPVWVRPLATALSVSPELP